MVGLFVALTGFQLYSFNSLQREVRHLRAQLEGLPEQEAPSQQTNRAQSSLSLGSLPARLAQLEQSVAELARTSELLVERGLVPPNAARMQDMQARFFDPSASDSDRLRALRMIRRNGQITDEVAAQALGLLQNSTNANTRRELLRQLDGLTNSTMKEPLLALLSTEQNGGVREELVDALGDFAQDPAVEAKMWDLALNDPNGEVREEAQDALTEGDLSPERVAALAQKAADPELSLDARLLALRGLREADATPGQLVSDLATLAQTSQDPVTRAKLFSAFDGINDPALMAPLVYGLQDPNPLVRERAADALSSFSSDPRIQEWLNHTIQNDADPRVKREAAQALEQAQRRRGRER